MTRQYLSGALLIALPLFCQSASNKKTHDLLRFTLNESPEQILKLLGRPDHIDDSLAGYQSWQYKPPADETSDDNSAPAWFVCLRTGNRQVLSMTRNFDKPQDADDLLPPAETTPHYWPSPTAPQFNLRLRQLPGDVLLVAMGTAKPGERTTQLILIRRSALKTFMPWLAEQL